MEMNQMVIKKFIRLLEQNGLIEVIVPGIPFYDEPRYYKFTSLLNFSKKYSDASPPHKKISSNGFSISSRYIALIKCLGESVERLSLYFYKDKKIFFSKLLKPDKKYMDITLYNNSQKKYNKTYGWVKGFNLTKKKSVLVPAQLVYLNYLSRHYERWISSSISTGAAGGFHHEETLLQGIYEIVERDAFMTAYLNKVPSPLVNIKAIKNQSIKKILMNLDRYRLKLQLFDITNDLQIPSYMSIITDLTQTGPPFIIGLRSHINPMKAIEGSIEEAIMGRSWLRSLLITSKKQNIITIKYPRTIKNRALLWLDPHKIPYLYFWLAQTKEKTIKPSNIKKFSDNKKVLPHIINLLRLHGFDIYYANLSNPLTSQLHYLVYKVIIPGLQPLYLDEKRKEIIKSRLNSVSEFFGIKNKINPIPHPFL